MTAFIERHADDDLNSGMIPQVENVKYGLSDRVLFISEC